MGRDGRFVYVANRGPNTVATFAWDGDGAQLVGEVSTEGDWPRHMTLVGDHLYVTNQISHSVTTFRVDRESGQLRLQGAPTTQASPTCVLKWNDVTTVS